MKVLISGIGVAIALGVIAAAALLTVQQPAYKAYSTSSTRIGDPGTNLVGKRWTGDPKVPRNES